MERTRMNDDDDKKLNDPRQSRGLIGWAPQRRW